VSSWPFVAEYPRLVVVCVGDEPTHDDAKTYTVPGMSCSHCVTAVSHKIAQVAGVDAVDVVLDSKLVTVRGDGVDDSAVRAAIGEAGYEAAA
jgi:copper chaperone